MKKLLGLSAALVFVSGSAFAGIAVDPIPAAHHAHEHHKKDCCKKHHHHKCCKKHKKCCKGHKQAVKHVVKGKNVTQNLNLKELKK